MNEPKQNPLEFRVDELLAEYMQKADSGNVPDRDEFLRQHPELREQLENWFEPLLWMNEHIMGPVVPQLTPGQPI